MSPRPLPPVDPAQRTGLQGHTDTVNAAAHAWRDDPARLRDAVAERAMLTGWSFEFFEQQIQALLQGSLGTFGFDATTDIEAITVNRRAHGYACEYMRPWDTCWPRGPLPCERARRG